MPISLAPLYSGVTQKERSESVQSLETGRKQPPESKEAMVAPVIVPTPEPSKKLTSLTRTGWIYARPYPPTINKTSQSKKKEEPTTDQADKVRVWFTWTSQQTASSHIYSRMIDNLSQFYNLIEEEKVPSSLTLK